MKSSIILALSLLLTLVSKAQNLSGYVYDENNAPVPYTNIYIKNISIGTSSDGEGKYYLMFDDPGMYEIVVSAVGYETQEFQVVFENTTDDKVKNIWLKTDENELEEVIINSKARDPAYGIIANAIERKKEWQTQYLSSTSDVYIKAKEEISEKERKKREAEAEQEQKEAEQELNVDVFEQEEKVKKAEINKIANSMNMVEIHMKRHWQYPNDIKEIREGYKNLGSSYGLFYLNTVETDFDFYDNLMYLNKLNELPVVSPLHITSVLTYKFKLEETYFENERKIYKIKVTPRKKGNATWDGYIWIYDKLFSIKAVDLSLDKNGLIIYSDFNVKQDYEIKDDTLMLLNTQDFTYESKAGRNRFKGSTEVEYNHYILNPTFPKKFFRNEVAVTTQEAYDQDTSYWEKIRPKPLTKEEQEYQRIKDSIMAYRKSDIYLDSVDSVYNKLTVMDVLWDGVGFSNRKKKKHLHITSLAGMLDPFEIGGLRVGPEIYYFKKWKNEKFLWLNPSVDIGIRNLDVKYDFSAQFRYDPMHRGVLGIYTGKLFNTIVENDALTNLFLRSNWIEEQRFTVYIRRELVNGLMAGVSLNYIDRFPIDKYEFGEFTDEFIDNNVPLSFTNYQTSIVRVYAAYTPFHKYMTEPYRKVILGSKWPTFQLSYEMGVPDFLGSDVNFSYLEANISQDFKLGTVGTTSYSVRGGKFLNTTDLRYVDYKIFPRGDKWFFASLLESMQIQDTTLTVQDKFLQINLIHRFNGAIINFIPLVKKLGIHAVAGSSALVIPESGYNYQEVFFGAERSFKMQRARYRIGVYFVEARSNFNNIQPRIKFAFNRYSLRDQSWGY